jgi:hypothetical protein
LLKYGSFYDFSHALNSQYHLLIGLLRWRLFRIERGQLCLGASQLILNRWRHRHLNCLIQSDAAEREICLGWTILISIFRWIIIYQVISMNLIESFFQLMSHVSLSRVHLRFSLGQHMLFRWGDTQARCNNMLSGLVCERKRLHYSF